MSDYISSDGICIVIRFLINSERSSSKIIRAMKKNMGTIDRIIRIAVAIIIAVLYFTGQITGTAAIILGIIAAAFILTSLVGTCPLYLPVGLSTKKE